MGGFGDIPFGDWHAKGRAKIGSTSPYTAQSPDDQRAGGMCFGQGGLFGTQISQQGRFVAVATDRAQNLAALLRPPAFQRNCSPGVAGPIAKGGQPAASFINQIF